MTATQPIWSSNGELEFEGEGFGVAFLDYGGTGATVFGYGEPEGIVMKLEASGVVAGAVLHFDGLFEAAVLYGELVEEPFSRRAVHCGDPEALAVGVDALDVGGSGAEGEDSLGFGEVGGLGL